MENISSNISLNKRDFVRLIENIDRFDLEEAKCLLQKENEHIELHADALRDAEINHRIAYTINRALENCCSKSLDFTIEYLNSSEKCEKTKNDEFLFDDLYDLSGEKNRYRAKKMALLSSLTKSGISSREDFLWRLSASSKEELDACSARLFNLKEKAKFEIDTGEFIRNSVKKALSVSGDSVV